MQQSGVGVWLGNAHFALLANRMGCREGLHWGYVPLLKWLGQRCPIGNFTPSPIVGET